MSEYRFGEWYSVRDGHYPLDDEYVIVSICDNAGDHPLRYTSVGFRSRNIINENAWIVDNVVRTDVEAWMPLPPPMKQKHCTMCGKAMDRWDLQENFGFDYRVGYGSIYDTCHVHADLCCNCFDKVLNYIENNSKTSPIVGVWE